MEPTYLELTFSKGFGARTEHIRVYIELNNGDADLLSGNTTEAISVAIVRRTGILDFLPRGINPDWPRFGKIMNHDNKVFGDSGITPTIIHGHNVWILEDT